MLLFLTRRLLHALTVVVFAATLAFVLLHLAPGDPFTSMFSGPEVSEAVRQYWREYYGFDRPLPEQYLRYARGVLAGELGWSAPLQRPVADVLADALPNTLLLMSAALLVSFALGIGLGVLQAMRRGRGDDRAIGAVTLFFYSVPDFWLALGVLVVFALWLGAFPVTGMYDPVMYDFMSPADQLLDRLHHLALPVATLALLSAAVVARHQRSAMLEVIDEDYVRTARAKGARERSVIARHALRNALLPVITLVGLAFPALLGGAVFVEKVFAWPGMGSLAVNAINTRDYPLLTACVIVGSAMVAVGGVLADVLSRLVDPRLRTA
jgi:peptide/nickel transport system permease protein